MLGAVNEPRGATAAIIAGLLMIALAAGGCSTNSASDASASSDAGSSSITGRMGSLFGSKSSTDGSVANAIAANPVTDIECPDVDIRTGAATLMVGSNPGENPPAALNLRYQGTIVRAARECAVVAGTVTMKVGVEGRIIKGPAGGPGQIDVPLRIAVVEEGPKPKTVLSKFYRIPVAIGDEPYTSFTKVDSSIAFPMPNPAGLIDSYIVYIGFDPSGAAQGVKQHPTRKSRKR